VHAAGGLFLWVKLPDERASGDRPVVTIRSAASRHYDFFDGNG